MKNIISIKTLIAVIGFVAFFATPQYSVAQPTSITFEKVKEICKDVPMDKRIPMSVARFAVKTKDATANATFGGELAEMLTNALTNVGCFQMLEMIDNLVDLERENNLKNDGVIAEDAESDTKFKNAKLIVTGDITEFSEGQSSTGAFGINVTGGRKAHLGFIIKVINNQNRQILFSTSVDEEAKTGGIEGVTFAGFKVAGSSKRSKSLTECISRAITKACEELAKNKDKFNILPQANGERQTSIKISNTNYAKISSLKTTVKGLTSSTVVISDVQTKFADSVGTLIVRHKGTSDELLELLMGNLGSQVEVTGVDKALINLTMKQ
jgi:curli biogenesis system outer membrane secretion channel CsgG